MESYTVAVSCSRKARVGSACPPRVTVGFPRASSNHPRPMCRIQTLEKIDFTVCLDLLMFVKHLFELFKYLTFNIENCGKDWL